MSSNNEKSTRRRSGCPVSCTMEIIGDKWSMLIIRDMMLWGKSTYNEFLSSSEKISTNILNDRLIMLTESGIIQYTGTAKRKKYTLTPMGNDLRPLLDAIGNFGVKHFKGSKEYVKKQMKEAGK